jgi:DNA-binding CsgD family transcriptional regulator
MTNTAARRFRVICCGPRRRRLPTRPADERLERAGPVDPSERDDGVRGKRSRGGPDMVSILAAETATTVARASGGRSFTEKRAFRTHDAVGRRHYGECTKRSLARVVDIPCDPPDHQTRRGSCCALADVHKLLAARGEYEASESLSETALSHEPTLQTAWRLRIEGLQRRGDMSAAINAAAMCLRTLREAHVEPEAATEHVVRKAMLPARGVVQTGRATYGWSSLTRTEDDVVALLLGGRTNRQIGVQLGISPRTVETHLAHVYDKLGIRTRVELAAEAARRGAGVS